MSISLRPFATFALIAVSFWACEPDLDALSSKYQPGSSGTGGTTPSSGGSSDVGGSSATGGTGGTSVTGGTGGDTSMAEGGAAGQAGAAGESTTGGTSGTSGTGGTGTSNCSNNMTDSNESDVDCGGSSKCERCPVTGKCTLNTDCDSGFCKVNRCANPTCNDGYKNQGETGVDCGQVCAPNLCDDGTACSGDGDCTSTYCDSGVCTDHCTSGRKDADETDKDCGGADCDPCADDKHCATGDDCQSQVCNNNVCDAPSCNDNVKNQDESDVDCGGSCVPGEWCTLHQSCNGPQDCDSSVCTSGKCGSDIVIQPDDVIDDFEDGDFILKPLGTPTRVGNWYAYGDGTGSQAMSVLAIPGDRGEFSTLSLHTAGGNFTSWGSGIGADLQNGGSDQSGKVPWDASMYAGITFWARADKATSVTLVLPDGDTDAAGGICNQDPVPPPGSGTGVCDHHWLKTVNVSAVWQRYTVHFVGELSLEPGGNPVPTAFDPSRLVSVQFRVSSGITFDYWIDDVAFVRP
jgi:hypothetical protein